VFYDVRGFLDKNKDALKPEIVSLLATSTDPLVRAMFPAAADEAEGLRGAKRRASSLIFESVTSQFRAQLSTLVKRVEATAPLFVRCLNPSPLKQPLHIHPPSLLEQLRASGLMAAVRVARAGFPVRIEHPVFVRRSRALNWVLRA
jgi:myosin heavy subunit